MAEKALHKTKQGNDLRTPSYKNKYRNQQAAETAMSEIEITGKFHLWQMRCELGIN